MKRGEEGRRAVEARKQALMEVAEAGSGNAQRQQRRSTKLKMESECKREAIQIYYDDKERRLKKTIDPALKKKISRSQ